jgi:glycosyltransferase 2 family protein
MAMNLWHKYKTQIRRAITIIIVLIVVLFFVKVLTQNWRDVAETFIKPNWLWLILAFFGFSLYYFMRILTWKKLMKDFGHQLTTKQSGEIIMLSEFARYVPGNIWSVLGRIGQSEKYGIHKSQSFYATIIEIFSLLSASVIVGGASSFFVKDLPYWFKFLILIAAISSILIFWFSKLFKKLVDWTIKKYKPESEIQTYSIKQNYQVLCLLVIGWIFYAAGGLFLTLSFFSLNFSQIWLVFAAMPIGWFLGFISFITPSGIGVREASVAALLKASLGATGVLIASFTRLGVTLVEFFWVVIFAYRYLLDFFTWLWKHLKQPKTLVITFILAFGIYFSIISCLMHYK